jgi:YHS domain-containing protein
MKRDPVCGLLINPADALRREYHGKTYYFCSELCKRDFDDRPDEYAEHPSTKVIDGAILDEIRILATAMQEQEGLIGH